MDHLLRVLWIPGALSLPGLDELHAVLGWIICYVCSGSQEACHFLAWMSSMWSWDGSSSTYALDPKRLVTSRPG
ncbi:hypothetical protein GDO81_002809 [Engystomops pustulosus]|uniref:Uncharacterized protein n=1 Tax=Engystomops pustulosus TaxID=76066 RepID=A0AAV7DR04_ENGPU|nr:hypothetical protein GDO81_002809 [Engystomops pustulosus]